MSELEATEISERIVEGAGHAIHELFITGNPAEAQISIALMCAFLCSQYDIKPEQFADTLGKNIQSVADDEILMHRTVEKLHNMMTMNNIIVPYSNTMN